MSIQSRKRKMFSRRTWLNTSTRLRAHLVGHVQYETWVGRDDVNRRSIDASLVVSDCDRTVTLEFDVYSDTDVAAMREKVRRTRTFVVGFCDAVDKALDEIEAAA